MYIVISVVIICVFLGLTQVTFFKTLLLIAKATPSYEQKGNDSASLLILGDSTGYGTGAGNSKGSIAGLIGADYPNLRITNSSVNGRTIGGLRKDIEKLEGEFDVILLQIGANDILQKRTVEETMVDLRAVLDVLSPKTKKIVMISSGNVGGAIRFKGEQAAAYKQQSIIFKDAFLALNSERPYFSYVDLYVAPEQDPFVLEPDIYTANDGLHPSNVGYLEWYKKLKPVLKTALEK
jgi:lysophospholipase L1-like esterase